MVVLSLSNVKCYSGVLTQKAGRDSNPDSLCTHGAGYGNPTRRAVVI